MAVLRRSAQAAGSTLCQLAMDAGELVNRDNNCNLQEAPKRALAVGNPATQCTAFRCAAFLGAQAACAARCACAG